jgi:DNA-binding NarL/FixJ family response regulator
MTPRFGTELALLDPRMGAEATTECPPVRVVLAHWARLGRAALRALLDGQPDIVVVGEAGSGEEAVQLARETRPDVVLMGRSVPGLDGLSALREIRADADLGQVKVLVLTGSADDDVFSAVRGGASGVLLNDAEPAELVGAVRVVGRGGALLSPAIAQRLIDEIHRALPEQQPPCPDKFAELTMRAHQSGDCATALGQRRDGQESREQDNDQARHPRPSQARRVRLSDRICPAPASSIQAG